LASEYNITVLRESPLIVQFEDFLSEEENQVLKDMAEPLMAPSTVNAPESTESRDVRKSCSRAPGERRGR
jgi:hypothetical protein